MTDEIPGIPKDSLHESFPFSRVLPCIDRLSAMARMVIVMPSDDALTTLAIRTCYREAKALATYLDETFMPINGISLDGDDSPIILKSDAGKLSAGMSGV